MDSSESGRVCGFSPSGPIGAVLLVAILVLGGCGGRSDSAEAPSERTSTAVSQTVVSSEPGTHPSTTVVAEAAPPTTVEPEGLPSATVRAALSAEEIYSLVAPSIPLVETPVGTGSGILIEGGLVVTNYHVVWPYERVWVVFPDGTEFADVPVLAWDAFADLALLGPVDVSFPYLDLSDGEGMSPGSEVYLIGYPAETDLFPEPTITGGVLSRIRDWELYGLTLLQTDADIAGGQSGGALVNSFGEVVGISTWLFGDAGFALATSAADDIEILLMLIEGLQEFGPWGVVSGGTGATEFVVDLENSLDSEFFVFEGEAGSILDIRIDGPTDGTLVVVGPSGVVLDIDDTYDGLEHGTAELDVDGPHFVAVHHLGDTLDEASSFTLESNVPLVPFIDPDDGQVLSVGGLVAGVIDHYADSDWFSIELFEGETVVFWTEAIATDTGIYVGPVGGSFTEAVWDDDSGPPLFANDTNAELVFTAPTTGVYYVGVYDPVGDGGAYFLGVDYAEPAVEGGGGGSGIGTEPVLDLLIDLDDETSWGQVFEVFAPAEQDCIREELGDAARLAGVLAAPVLSDAFDDEIAGVFRCLQHDTATELMIAAIVAGSAQEQVFFEAEHVACLREVFSGEGGATFLTAMFSETESEDDIGEVALEFLLCFPDETLWGGDQPDPGGTPAELPGVPVGESVWSYVVPGGGDGFLPWNLVSPPVMEDGTLFVPANDGTVYALSAAGGELLWAYETVQEGGPEPPHRLKAVGVEDGVLFVVGETHVHAVDAETGEGLWSYPTYFHSGVGMGEGALYIPQSFFDLDAVDTDSGVRLWSYQTDGLSIQAPVPGDGVVLFGADGEYLYAMDAEAGELAWRHEILLSVFLSPLVADGLVYTLTDENEVFVLDSSAGELIWRNRIPGTTVDLMQLFDGLLYISSDALYALDAAAGGVVWQFPTESYGAPYWSYGTTWEEEAPYFTVDRGVVYFGSYFGAVIALDAATGQLLWEYQTVSGEPAAPTVSEDTVYLGELGGGLYALDRATGRLLWHYPTDADVISFPIVEDGVIYVTTADGRVHAVRAP